MLPKFNLYNFNHLMWQNGKTYGSKNRTYTILHLNHKAVCLQYFIFSSYTIIWKQWHYILNLFTVEEVWLALNRNVNVCLVLMPYAYDGALCLLHDIIIYYYSFLHHKHCVFKSSCVNYYAYVTSMCIPRRSYAYITYAVILNGSAITHLLSSTGNFLCYFCVLAVLGGYFSSSGLYRQKDLGVRLQKRMGACRRSRVNFAVSHCLRSDMFHC